MRFAAFAFVSLMAAVLFAAPPVQAAASEHGPNASAVEISAQSRDGGVRARPRTRLRVTPRYPCRNYVTFYPLPYDIECPGPNTVRLCDFKLVQERRPSGTVIVPRQRCWWARR